MRNVFLNRLKYIDKKTFIGICFHKIGISTNKRIYSIMSFRKSTTFFVLLPKCERSRNVKSVIKVFSKTHCVELVDLEFFFSTKSILIHHKFLELILN